MMFREKERKIKAEKRIDEKENNIKQLLLIL